MSKENPRNVDDVDFATLDGPRRMREVLAELDRLNKKQPKALREEAFRTRAGIQAELVVCLCCYPLVLRPTRSLHEPWCPSEGMVRSRLAQEQVDRDRLGR